MTTTNLGEAAAQVEDRAKQLAALECTEEAINARDGELEQQKASLQRDEARILETDANDLRLDEIERNLKSIGREQRALAIRRSKVASEISKSRIALKKAKDVHQRASADDTRARARAKLMAARAAWSNWSAAIAELDGTLRELEAFPGGAADVASIILQLPGGMAHMAARAERLEREGAVQREEQKRRDEPNRLKREAAYQKRVRKEFGDDFGGKLLVEPDGGYTPR